MSRSAAVKGFDSNDKRVWCKIERDHIHVASITAYRSDRSISSLVAVFDLLLCPNDKLDFTVDVRVQEEPRICRAQSVGGSGLWGVLEQVPD